MSFILVPSNAKNILNDNFTLVSEIKEGSKFDEICNPLDVMQTTEGDTKSAVYKVKTSDFVADTLQYIPDMDADLQKDFIRMEYFHGNEPFSSLEEFKIFLNEIDDQKEKMILSTIGLASCLGLPMAITSKSISYTNTRDNAELFFYLAEMSSPMVATVRRCPSSRKWDVRVTKTVRCCAFSHSQSTFRKRKEERGCQSLTDVRPGTSFGVCAFEIVRKAADPENTYISIDFLRLPRRSTKSEPETLYAPLLDFHPTSVTFSHH